MIAKLYTINLYEKLTATTDIGNLKKVLVGIARKEKYKWVDCSPCF